MTSTLFRNAALADARSRDLRKNITLLVTDDRIAWLGPDDGAPEPPVGTRRIDASGTTIVPAMVDAHSHVSLPGGAHWIARIEDSTDDLLATAEDNGRRLIRAGIRWARDVGSPTRVVDGEARAVSLHVRDRWRDRRDRPTVRASGAHIGKAGALPALEHLFDVPADADALLAVAERQLAGEGADHLKLYLDGPDPDDAIWSASDIARVVALADEHGARVTAHATQPGGTKAGVFGGVASIEHGDVIEPDVAAEMARRGTFLVTTHSVFRSWLTFGNTTQVERFVGAGAIAGIEARLESARDSARTAHRAGVPIAAGSDFGGGSLRAGHLAWEVEALVEAGLEPWEALAAATWRGGELLDEPDAGTIRIGGPSDAFLVHGDPLSDPAALWRVVEVL